MNNKEKAKELSHDYFRRGQLGLVSPDSESAGYKCAMEMAEWKDNAALNAYCDVCGHYHHTVPNHICRLDCKYYSSFKNKLKGGNK